MNEVSNNNLVVGKNVVFGDNVQFGRNVVIHDNVRIGSNVIIMDNVIIGKIPTRAKSSILPEVKAMPACEIGSGVTIGTSAIIYANAKIQQDVFIADLATVRERVTIGENTIVGRGVAVENDCQIGSNCKLETNCYITAYSEIEDYVFVAPGVITTNDNFMGRTKERFGKFKGVTIKRGGRIGANATILPGKVIFEDGVVAAGSLVTKDVEKETLVAGVPAKVFKKVDENQLLKNQE